MAKVEKISPSRIRTFMRCPMQFRYSYVEGLKIPPPSALTVGSSFHSGMGHNYKQKIQTHKDLPLDDVLDVYSTEFDERSHITRWHKNEDKGKVKDAGAGAVRVYHQEVAPVLQPIDVEQQFQVMMTQGGKLLPWFIEGYVDLIDENGVIAEAKTTAKTPKQPNQMDTVQTAAYAAGMSVTAPGEMTTARIDYAVKIKKPVTVTFERKVSASEIRFLFDVVTDIVRAVEADIFIPNRQSFMCSDRSCGYWHVCHKDKGGYIHDG